VIRTLYGKLVAVLLGFTLIIAVLFLVSIRYSDLARTQENNQILYRSLATRVLAPEMQARDGVADAAVVRQVEDRIQFVNPRIEAYLLDAAGKVIAAPGQQAAIGRAVSIAPLERLLAGDTQLPILGDDPAYPDQKRVFSVASVPLTDGSDGYLYLVIRTRAGDTLAERVANSNVLRELLVLMAGGLLVTLAAAALIVQIITRPVRRLTVFVDRFRKSGFAEQPEPARIAAGGDEIGRLADTFNRMAERMLTQMEAMKQADATRRELIANISHDLRTPLSSLQGYLETLQVRQAVLTPAEKEAYLQTALRHTEQLSQLVAKLFELAKLDSEQATVFPEPFVLEDLVQDVIQEFELAIRQKGVRLETRAALDLPLVYGDIGLIERVLRNLLENALRHTEAGGTIGIAVVAAPEACRVEVWDTGAGIEPADLPRIFDRFYRGEKSRGDAATHAGLGLAIVKRIIDLHGGTIEASSRPGMTVFTFTLGYASRSSGPAPAPAPETSPARQELPGKAAVVPISRARSAGGRG
jgi:two-component system OmpR family sensor kinase